MSLAYHIRLIEEKDISHALEVYSPYILNTTISFEYEVPSPDDWVERVHSITRTHPWLVCELNGIIAGYAYACTHKTRSAYKWSVDSAVYVREEYHGSGVARKLYAKLFSILKHQGFINVYAGITLPNIKSEKFHASFGFEKVGIYENVGYKFGAWRSVGWYALHLSEHKAEPEPPVPLHHISSDVINEILNSP